MREQWIYEIHKRKGRLHGMYKNAKKDQIIQKRNWKHKLTHTVE